MVWSRSWWQLTSFGQRVRALQGLWSWGPTGLTACLPSPEHNSNLDRFASLTHHAGNWHDKNFGRMPDSSRALRKTPCGIQRVCVRRINGSVKLCAFLKWACPAFSKQHVFSQSDKSVSAAGAGLEKHGGGLETPGDSSQKPILLLCSANTTNRSRDEAIWSAKSPHMLPSSFYLPFKIDWCAAWSWWGIGWAWRLAHAGGPS